MSQAQTQAQPVGVLYPNPGAAQYQNPNSVTSHSNGSFGPVFVVLAVIVVISAVACVLGRLCSRRKHRGGKDAAAAHHHSKANNKKQSNGLGPKEWESTQKPSFNMRDGDIEFGFDKKMKMPSAKGVKTGGGPPPHQNGGRRPEPPHQNGGNRPEPPHGYRPEVRFADNV